jgi:hypothetical protein
MEAEWKLWKHGTRSRLLRTKYRANEKLQLHPRNRPYATCAPSSIGHFLFWQKVFSEHNCTSAATPAAVFAPIIPGNWLALAMA